MTTEKCQNFVIFYGSQTGNAEWIAKNIHQESIERGFISECYVLDDYNKVDFSKEKVLVFVISNTGDGDPPDNSIKFFRFLRKIKSKTYLSHAKFSILGLGDTNYSNFNNTAKRLEKKLLDLGGSSFYNTGLADDAVGLESIVDPWIANLWLALANVCVQKQKDSGIDVTESIVSLSIKDNSQNTNNLQSSENDSHLTNGNESESIKLGNKILLDLTDIVDSDQLTAIPRIPTVFCKISRLNKEKVTTPLPSFLASSSRILNTRINAVRCLTHPNAVKKTLHLELDIKDLEFSFIPGDAFEIFAPNHEVLVKGILNTLGINENMAHEEISIEAAEGIVDLPIHLKKFVSTSIFELLQYGVDLTSLPRKALLRMMADYTSDDQEKRSLFFLCSKQGSQQLNRLYEQRPTILDLLVTFPSCKPPIERLLDTLPQHQPRYYSIVNSPLMNPNELHFAFNIVDYYTPNPYNIQKHGVCTTWLDKLCGYVNEMNVRTILNSNITIPIALKTNQSGFNVPSDISKPLIMIGPGTGVAPFIGFLQHRELQFLSENNDKHLGDMWLFYGCRDKEKDFLYRKELEGFVERGILKELFVAVSRAPDAGVDGKPKYVQDIMRIKGRDIFELITKKDAIIFVCGDAKGMAKGVNDALADILVEHGQMQQSEALDLLKKWLREKRYLRDLWG
ncbi:riboflavin synthase domain-like protein [Gigaspora margarita]|uniref:Methionine synthase reductase n=1 Tax=Gigaspora margarita TaxID=4874 RepID=A0A8H4ALP7_GIGMA|nr:riboflavin synthase domain-like protein [Gigaspora margarita]